MAEGVSEGKARGYSQAYHDSGCLVKAGNHFVKKTYYLWDICLLNILQKGKKEKKNELRIPRWLAPGAVFCVLVMSHIVVRGEAGEVLCVGPCFENRIHQKQENY